MDIVNYDFTSLLEYCNLNKIALNCDYSNEKITRDSYIEGICIYDGCDKSFKKRFRQLRRTGAYCINCSKIISNNKKKATCLERFGVEHSLQSKEVREKAKETIKNIYGVDNVSQNQNIKIKKANTCMKNHGVDVSFKSEIIMDKIKNTFMKNYECDNPLKSDKIKEKIKKTNKDKYGYENPQQCSDIHKKTEETCLNKYGVKNVFLLEENIHLRKQACILKFGNEFALKTELGKEIVKNTCLEKYGVENPQQNPEIAEKISKNSYKRKKYIMPSGKELICQGYEPFALDKLIKEDNINEDDIITGCKNVPTIWYNDENGKKHRHYVDIYIPSQNRCIEVKSTWTAEKKKDNIYLKQQSAKELGYNYEIWIYNSKKELVEKKTI